jgi:hypothetical protein
VSATEQGWIAVITTRTRTYESMMLVSAEATRTSEKGTVLEAALVFMPVRIVATGRVEGGAPEPARPRNRANSDEGQQSTSEVDEERRSSLLNQGFDFLLGGG